MRHEIGAGLAILAMTATPALADMVEIEGGAFLMGSENHNAEEGPVRQVTIGPFRIGQTEVTNTEFAEFVTATGYLTTAERTLDPAECQPALKRHPLSALKRDPLAVRA